MSSVCVCVSVGMNLNPRESVCVWCRLNFFSFKCISGSWLNLALKSKSFFWGGGERVGEILNVEECDKSAFTF